MSLSSDLLLFLFSTFNRLDLFMNAVKILWFYLYTFIFDTSKFKTESGGTVHSILLPLSLNFQLDHFGVNYITQGRQGPMTNR